MTARYCAARNCRTIVNGDTILCCRHQAQAMTTNGTVQRRVRPAATRRRRTETPSRTQNQAKAEANRTGRFDEDRSWFDDSRDEGRQLDLFDVGDGWGGQQ